MVLKKIFFLLALYMVLLFLCYRDFRPRQPVMVGFYNNLNRRDESGLDLFPIYAQLVDDGLNALLFIRNLRALKLDKEGHTGLALEYLAASEAQNPDYYHTYFIRAGIYAAHRELIPALQEYTKLIALVPRAPALVYNRGLLYLNRGSRDLALADFLHTLNLDKNFPGANLKVADILFERESYRQAVPFYTRSLESQPLPSREAINRVYTKYYTPGLSPARKQRAEARLKAIKIQQQEGVEQLLRRGKAYSFLGETALAARDYTLVLELDRQNKTARLARLLAYRDLENWPGALVDLDVLKESDESKPRLLALEAEIVYRQGKREQALALLSELKREAPDYLDTYLDNSPEEFHDPEFAQLAFFTPLHPLRMLLIGDSMAGGALRIALENILADREWIDYSYEYKVSSGLSNSWYFDWQEKIEEILAAQSYHLIIIIMGTNDGQAIREEGVLHAFSTPGWNAIYQRRLEEFLGTIAEKTNRVFWLGMPPMASVKFNQKMVFLNSFYKQVSASLENVTYLSTFDILGGGEGKFEKYIEIDGEKVPTRFGDDIHFRLDGIMPLVTAIFKEINKDFLLPE